MALVVPDEGEVQFLKLALGGGTPENLTLKLYTNSPTLNENLTAASFTEVSGTTGYTAKTLVNGANWNIGSVSNVTSATYNTAQAFSFTGSVTVNGYYLVGASSGKVYWAEAFASPAAIPTGGGSITFTPTITLD